MRVFWKPVLRGRVSGLWARCDSCNWSGPFEAFSIWDAKSGPLYICRAPECNTPLVHRALVDGGYVLWAPACGPATDSEAPR
jgi:hypothetical protein